MKHLIPLIPKEFDSYHEPFVGGGALFFALQPKISFLADRNPDLVNCYVQVRDRPEAVIAVLRKWGASEHEYYRIRKLVSTHEVERAARLIYLTRLSFNGIHRLNARGEFNVPYGHRPHLGSCDPERILTVSRALSGASICCRDFEQSTAGAQPGDLVYFDPPYVLPDDRTRFVRYNDKNFTWSDQIRLSQVVHGLVSRGVKVIVSNADHPEVRKLYRDLVTVTVRRNSSIAADGKQRGPTTECIFHSED